jgi:hypothetical protein
MAWRKCRMAFGGCLRYRDVGVRFRRGKWWLGTSTVISRQVLGDKILFLIYNLGFGVISDLTT